MCDEGLRDVFRCDVAERDGAYQFSNPIEYHQQESLSPLGCDQVT